MLPMLFAALRVLHEELTVDEVARIYIETQRSNQTIDWNEVSSRSV